MKGMQYFSIIILSLIVNTIKLISYDTVWLSIVIATVWLWLDDEICKNGKGGSELDS